MARTGSIRRNTPAAIKALDGKSVPSLAASAQTPNDPTSRLAAAEYERDTAHRALKIREARVQDKMREIAVQLHRAATDVEQAIAVEGLGNDLPTRVVDVMSTVGNVTANCHLSSLARALADYQTAAAEYREEAYKWAALRNAERENDLEPDGQDFPTEAEYQKAHESWQARREVA